MPTWAIQYRRAGPSDRTFLGRGDPDRLRGEPALAGLERLFLDLAGSIYPGYRPGGGPGSVIADGAAAGAVIGWMCNTLNETPVVGP